MQCARVLKALADINREQGSYTSTGLVVGLSGLSVRRLLDRANKPSKRTATLVAGALGVSVDMLLTGKVTS